MILIKNAQVFAPKALGKKDVLLAYDKILEIADCIETARQFKIPNIRVHATSGGEVTDALVECLRRSERS